jgi:hypothetical protein
MCVHSSVSCHVQFVHLCPMVHGWGAPGNLNNQLATRRPSEVLSNALEHSVGVLSSFVVILTFLSSTFLSFFWGGGGWRF